MRIDQGIPSLINYISLMICGFQNLEIRDLDELTEEFLRAKLGIK